MGAICLAACLVLGIIDPELIMRRGDANDDNAVNVSDVVYLNSFLYQGGPAPPCMNQADVNHDGLVNGSDPVYLLNWLYNGGAAPPAPGPTNSTCTNSSSPYLGCNSGC